MHLGAIELLPLKIKENLFVVFDGTGRLTTQIFTKKRAMNKVAKGLARQVGPFAIQHKAVFNDDCITFNPDLTFPRDLIILTSPLNGRYAEMTTMVIELHNIEAIKNQPGYDTIPDPRHNGIHNHYPSYHVNPMPKKPFGPMKEYQVNKNAIRRLMRRVQKNKGASRSGPAISI